MKKLFLALGLCLMGSFIAQSQGLEDIIVEKYYVSNAADAAASAGTLPSGSTTYRIYVDMAPGYIFQMAYGDATHELFFETSTSFFNNEDRGSTTPSYTKAQAAQNTVMLDSWLSVGAACAGQIGLLKSEDNGVATVVNANGVLANNTPRIGIPLTLQDGMIAGTPEAVTFVGISPANLSLFDATSQAGNRFSTTDGAWASLNGSTGATATNRVLIGQFTTDGVFEYQINIQIRSSSNQVEKYVYANAGAGEQVFAKLSGTLGAPNVSPLVSVTTPATGYTCKVGDVVKIKANASDFIGTDGEAGNISSVQFFLNGTTSLGTFSHTTQNVSDSINWTAVIGTHTITARATDNEGAVTTSTGVLVVVNANALPTVSITTDSASVYQTNTVVITAASADADGTVSKVDFYRGSTLMGTVNNPGATCTYSWTTTGILPGFYTLTAKATDNNNGVTTSNAIQFEVKDTSAAAYYVLPTTGNCTENVFLVPVSKVNGPALSNCTGFDLVMTYESDKVIPTGVVVVHNTLIDSLLTSYTVDIKDTSINISVYLNSSAPSSAGFNGIGKAFSVEFSKLANFNAVDTVLFTVPNLRESYKTSTVVKQVKSDTYISYKNSTFSGKLKFWANNNPIVYDAANPSEYLITNIYGNRNIVTAVQPNLSGEFNYDINNGDTINIERDIHDTVTVMPIINGYDAYFVQKVLVDYPGYVPNVYQIIAMDVNMDGIVSAGDLSQINQRTVKTINEFKQVWNASTSEPSKDWLFVNLSLVQGNISYKKSATYPKDDGKGYSKLRVPQVQLSDSLPILYTLDCPEIGTQTYQGILLGDVNGSFASGINDSTMKIAVQKVVFDLSNATISENYVNVPVILESDSEIHSLDFSTKLNSNLSFVNVIDNNNTLNMLSNITDEGTVMFTSSSLENYNRTPVTVRFLSSNGKITQSDLNSLTAYINGEKANVDYSLTAGINDLNNDQLIKVYPNPATSQLNIEVSEKSVVQIFDISGKQMVMETLVNANEAKTLNVSSLTTGIYILKVINSTTVETKRIVINR